MLETIGGLWLLNRLVSVLIVAAVFIYASAKE